MAAGETLYLGVDAGATRVRARLRDAAGMLIAESEGPAANAYVNFDVAVAVARNVVARAIAAAGSGKNHTTQFRLGLGVAGVSTKQEADRFAAALADFGDARVVNDAVSACIGAHGGEDGGLLIIGTGTAGLARVRGREVIVGGRGFLLGDDGSAARIGADALRAALRAHDGLGLASTLTREILARFADDPEAMLRWAPSAKPGDYGAFAPLVVEAAAAGDPNALSIIDAAVHAVGALAAAVEALGAERIAAVGGLCEPLRPFYSPALSAKIRAPRFDPTDGAILLAGGVLPTEPAS